VVRVTWVKEKEMEEDENASSQKKLSSPQLNSTILSSFWFRDSDPTTMSLT
jgi:hypothetical protein